MNYKVEMISDTQYKIFNKDHEEVIDLNDSQNACEKARELAYLFEEIYERAFFDGQCSTVKINSPYAVGQNFHLVPVIK